MARPWNSMAREEFKFSDRERWICVYPCYINIRKTVKEGRRIPKEKAVDNPTYTEMKDVCAAAGLTLGVENKVHPRELEPRDLKYRGRIRVQLKNDDGSPMLAKFPTKRSVLEYLGDTIPKLKGRASQQGGGGAQGGQQQQSGGGQKKKDKKKRK